MADISDLIDRLLKNAGKGYLELSLEVGVGSVVAELRFT